jgi:sugar phosphate isomerase/epimerase
MQGEDFMFPLIGEGSVDWDGFFLALDEIGYSGYLTVEYESFDYYEKILKKDPVKAAELSMEQLKQLFISNK